MTSNPRSAAPVEHVLRQVARVLNHESFTRSQGPARLLSHFADELIQNGGRPCDQAALAEVLGLPPDFDPTSNPLVRMHVSKLRRKLRDYHRGDGRHDDIVLEIPLNSYRLMGYENTTRAKRELHNGFTLEPAEPATHALERPAVLVAEFSTACDRTARLAQHIAVELVNALVDCPIMIAKGPALRERLQASGEQLQLAASQFGCDYVLDGSLSLGGRGVEIIPRLMKAKDNRLVWTEWLDHPFDFDSDSAAHVALHIVARLRATLDECVLA